VLFHGRTQAVEQRIRAGQRRLALEHEPEATLGRGALDDQSMPRNSAPWVEWGAAPRPPPLAPPGSLLRPLQPLFPARRRLSPSEKGDG
jgi:hypothetical protein